MIDNKQAPPTSKGERRSLRAKSSTVEIYDGNILFLKVYSNDQDFWNLWQYVLVVKLVGGFDIMDVDNGFCMA